MRIPGHQGDTMGDYTGKYRAVVVDNADPLAENRLLVNVPEVGTEGWAKPLDHGHEVPAVGAEVWVEFEHGEADYPIWDGAI
jgi:hypothetical protein